MTKRHLHLFSLLIIANCFFMACQVQNPLEEIMDSDLPKIKLVADHLEQHEVQILYTQIERSADGQPLFKEYEFQLDDSQYFYPASTAKMPVAILALQKINELQKKGININKDTPFIIKETNGEIVIDTDSTAELGKPTIAHMIKKIFLVSDNEAYNYLFDFLGRDYVNSELAKKGMTPAHINHKFMAGADNENTWTFDFIDTNGAVLYHQPSIKSTIDKHNLPLKGMVKGKSYTDNEGNLFEGAFHFEEKNYFSLRSLNKILKSIIFPASIPASERFNLTVEQYEFLRFWMSRNALESEYPNYTKPEYYDSYVKLFMFGDSKEDMPKNIRLFSKVGNAYGTSTDVAYIRDNENEVEFMLSATILANANGTFNDGVYEYDEVSFPFLAELGRQIYAYELKRK